MASAIVFLLLLRRVLGLVGLRPKPDDKDVEIAVLRRQVLSGWAIRVAGWETSHG